MLAAVLAGGVGDEALDLMRRSFGARHMHYETYAIAADTVLEANCIVAGFLF